MRPANVHERVLYTSHAYKYVYTSRVQPTPTLVIAESRSDVPHARPPSHSLSLSRSFFFPLLLSRRPSRTCKRLHTNIAGIPMGGMLIRESTLKFFHYLWILIFRTVALRLAARERPEPSNLAFLRQGYFSFNRCIDSRQRSMLPATTTTTSPPA